MFVPVLSPFIFSSETKEQIDARNKRLAEESNFKHFIKAEKQIPALLKQSSLFNVLSASVAGGGCSFLISLKKYPNFYTAYEYSIERPNTNLTFKCYINEHKWTSFEVNELQFMQMIGFLETGIRTTRKWFWTHREKQSPLMTTEQFLRLVEMTIANHGYELVPFKFHYEQENFSENINSENAEEFINKKNIFYYNKHTNKIEMMPMRLDATQERLLRLFAND